MGSKPKSENTASPAVVGESARRPSANWPSPNEALEKMHYEYRARVSSFVSSLPWEKIESVAVALRNPRVPCTANREKYTWGVISLAVELLFEDGVAWVIRVRLPAGDLRWVAHQKRVEDQALMSEIATMQLVRERTTIPVPAMIAFSASTKNPIGCAYIIQEGIVGFRPEDVGIHFHQATDFSKDKTERYMRQLVDYHLQLSRIRFPKIGSIILDGHGNYDVGPLVHWQKGPYPSSIGYFSVAASRIEVAAQKAATATPLEKQQRLFVAWLYRTAISHVANSGDLRGPFPLAHNDLHTGNTIVDEDGNILAVLDWDYATTVPLERFATPSYYFGALPSSSKPDVQKRVALFNAILRELEPSFYPRATTSSGRTFASLHASAEATVASVIGPLLEHTHGDFRFARDLYQLLYGKQADVEEGFKSITSAPLFVSWVEALQRKDGKEDEETAA